MIDIFSLALSHGLLLLAAWRLLARTDLDNDGADPSAPGAGWFARKPADAAEDRNGA